MTAIGVLGRTAYVQRHEIVEASRTLGVRGFALAASALVLAAAAQWFAWHLLSRSYGGTLRAGTSATIYGIGVVGKYAPGGVWTTLLQIEYSARAGQRRLTFLLSSVTAMIVTLVTGVVVGALAVPTAVTDVPPWAWFGLLLLIPAVLLLHPGTLVRVAARVAPGGQRPDTTPGLGLIAAASAVTVAAWTLYGAHLVALGDGRPNLLAASSGYALAWSLGFLVVFVPAGAGVRDVVVFAVLDRHIGREQAIAVTLLSRSVNTVVDLVIGATALLAERWTRAHRNRSAAAELGSTAT